MHQYLKWTGYERRLLVTCLPGDRGSFQGAVPQLSQCVTGQVGRAVAKGLGLDPRRCGFESRLVHESCSDRFLDSGIFSGVPSLGREVKATAELSEELLERLAAPVAKLAAPMAKLGAPVPRLAAPMAKLGAPVPRLAAPMAKVGAPVTRLTATMAKR
jgi:hypothetical protein